MSVECNREQRSDDRKEQLYEIMQDAVRRVLERPDSRRGPYVISDNFLRQVAAAR